MAQHLKKKKRFRKAKAFSSKAKSKVRKNYARPKRSLSFEEIAARFKPVSLSDVPELAPYIEVVNSNIDGSPSEEIIHNFNFRVIPSEASSDQISKTIGCVRLMHNAFVGELYKYLESINYKGGRFNYKVPLYPAIKKIICESRAGGADFLNAADSTAYTSVRDDFEQTLKIFNAKHADKPKYCKRAVRRANANGAPLTFRDFKGMPKFHAKHYCKDAYQSNAVNGNIKIMVPENEDIDSIYTESFHAGNYKGFKPVRALLKLPKTDEVEIVIHRPLPKDSRITNAVITREKSGEYTATLTISYHQTFLRIKNTPEAQDAVKVYLSEHPELSLGLDYAQKEGCVPSGSPETRKNLELLIEAVFGKGYRHMEARLAYLKHRQKRTRRPNHREGILGSRMYQKLQSKIAKLDAKVARRRKDALDKLSRVLSGAFLLIAVEDIDLQAMSQGLHLAKNLLDNGFGMFRAMLRYKLTEQGKLYVVVDKWFASSQICHGCGYKNPETKDLSTREWDCPVCRTHHNRDENTAENIRAEGVRTLENAALFQAKKRKATKEKYSKRIAA